MPSCSFPSQSRYHRRVVRPLLHNGHLGGAVVRTRCSWSIAGGTHTLLLASQTLLEWQTYHNHCKMPVGTTLNKWNWICVLVKLQTIPLSNFFLYKSKMRCWQEMNAKTLLSILTAYMSAAGTNVWSHKKIDSHSRGRFVAFEIFFAVNWVDIH